jgi:hypothetical protein
VSRRGITARLIGSTMSKQEHDRELYEAAYEELLKELPESIARALARLQAPGMRWARLAIGILFVVGGALSFLPVLGIELLPLGMLLLAQDAAFLHRPVGNATLWIVDRVRAFKRWSGCTPKQHGEVQQPAT